jgi:hypothetical protein
MRMHTLFVCFSMSVALKVALGTDLLDVLANPDKYNERQVDLVGIARVPGYFYLFADVDAAARVDLAKALLIRKNNFAGNEYRELDRQWVRVIGIVSSEPRIGWDSGTGVLLQRAELLRDRPPPHIKDPTVVGVFQNTTGVPLVVNLLPRSDGGRTTFFLRAYETDKTPIEGECEAVVCELKGPDNVPLYKRQVGRRIATCTITFRGLPSDYEYSPEWSAKRMLYFRIFTDRIELVAAPEARNWKISESKRRAR